MQEFLAKLVFAVIAPAVMIGFVILCFVFLKWDFGVVYDLSWLAIRKIYLGLFLIIAVLAAGDKVNEHRDW